MARFVAAGAELPGHLVTTHESIPRRPILAQEPQNHKYKMPWWLLVVPGLILPRTWRAADGTGWDLVRSSSMLNGRRGRRSRLAGRRGTWRPLKAWRTVRVQTLTCPLDQE